MDFKDIIQKTLEVNGRFKTEFSDHGRALSLVSEVGELAEAILEYDGGKGKGTRDPKGKEEIADAMADLLYNVIVLASHYDVDLEKEYEKVLGDVEKRFEKGEFVGKEADTGSSPA
jgi:NTP pyrophosphatase (non-canonical NTP hydrolase)